MRRQARQQRIGREIEETGLEVGHPKKSGWGRGRDHRPAPRGRPHGRGAGARAGPPARSPAPRRADQPPGRREHRVARGADRAPPVRDPRRSPTTGYSFSGWRHGSSSSIAATPAGCSPSSATTPRTSGEVRAMHAQERRETVLRNTLRRETEWLRGARPRARPSSRRGSQRPGMIADEVTVLAPQPRPAPPTLGFQATERRPNAA